MEVTTLEKAVENWDRENEDLFVLRCPSVNGKRPELKLSIARQLGLPFYHEDRPPKIAFILDGPSAPWRLIFMNGCTVSGPEVYV